MTKTHCPICDKVMQVADPKDWPSFPFCSSRCQTIDLGRWLDGRYRVPDEEATSELQTEDGAGV